MMFKSKIAVLTSTLLFVNGVAVSADNKYGINSPYSFELYRK